jgi:hypothetical protein
MKMNFHKSKISSVLPLYIVKRLAFLVIMLLLSPTPLCPQSILEPFESLTGWSIEKQVDALVVPSTVQGESGKCLKLEYDVGAATGYLGLSKQFDIALPDNYSFSLMVRGDFPPVEFQLTLEDDTTKTGWRYVSKELHPSAGWTKMIVKKRHFIKAWGADTLLNPSTITKIEIGINVPVGGKGVLYLDELAFTPAEAPKKGIPVPVFFASSAMKGNEASKAADRNMNTCWRSEGKQAQEHIVMDLRGVYEFGGLKIAWDSSHWAKEFAVSQSDDGKVWQEMYSVKNGNGLVSFIPLPEGEARYLKLNLKSSAAKNKFAIREIALLGVPFSANANSVYEEISKTFPRGLFPAYFTGTDTFRTVTSFNAGDTKIFLSSDGAAQIDGQPFRFEPFITANGTLLTPRNAVVQYGASGVPEAVRDYGNISLRISAASVEDTSGSFIKFKYEISSFARAQSGNLYVALRPFSIQLDTVHKEMSGTLTVNSINYDGLLVILNNKYVVTPVTQTAGFGTAEFDQGDIAMYCRVDSLPPSQQAIDLHNAASCAFKYSFNLPAYAKEHFEIKAAIKQDY